MKRLLLVLASLAILTFTQNPPFLPTPVRDVPIARAAPVASGALSPAPLNFNYDAPSKQLPGTPDNYDFETGSLSPWTVSGPATIGSGGPTGYFAQVSNDFQTGTLISNVVTIDSDTQMLTFDYAVKKWGSINLYVATNAPDYDNWTLIGGVNAGGSAIPWGTKTFYFWDYRGQSMKMKFTLNGGCCDAGNSTKLDNAGVPWATTPLWEPLGSAQRHHIIQRLTDGPYGAYSWVTEIDGYVSNGFTIPPCGAALTFWRRLDPGSNTSYSITIRYGPNYENKVEPYIMLENAPGSGDAWQMKSIDLSAYAGTNVKIDFNTIVGTVGFDEVGISAYQCIQLPNRGGQGGGPTAGGDPVDFASGAFMHQHTDIAIPGKGIPLAFTRFYSSGAAGDVGLGDRWTHTYSARANEQSDDSVHVYGANGSLSVFTEDAGTYTAPIGVRDVLVKNGTKFELRKPEQVVYTFDVTTGRLETIKDRNDNTTSLAYDVNGDLETVTDPGGRELTFTVDGSGRITQISDPLSRTVSYTYDSNGDLIKVTDVKSGETEFTYSEHRLLTIEDSLNNTVNTNIYDSANRVVEQEDGITGIGCFYYGHGPSYTSTNCPGVTPSPSAGTTVYVDPEGNETTYFFDTSFRTTDVENALGDVTSYTYETSSVDCNDASSTTDLGNLCTITDPLTHETNFTYDDATGNRLTVKNALNKTWTYTYNSFNDVLTETDPLSNVTTYVYDTDGNLTSVTNDLSEVTTFNPNTDGTLESVTDDLSHKTSYTYDSNGNLATVTNAEAEKTTFSYDDGGRLLWEEDPLGNRTTNTYDSQNNILTVTDHLSNVTTYVYDAKGQRTSITDANSKITAFVYDAAGRLTTVTDPLSQTVTYAYDANGNRTSMTNTRGKTTTYAYDALNRLTSTTDPLSRTTSYTYDAAGRQVSRTDGNGSVTNYSYDALGQITLVDYPVGMTDSSFIYDELGNRLTMVDGTGTTSYSYDALYRLTSVTDGAANTVSYAYDAGGRRTSITYPGGVDSVTYGYDNANRLTSVTDWNSNATSYTYDVAHRLTNTSLPNGITTDYTYDNADRLLTLTNKKGVVTLSSYSYTLDSVGNRTQMVESAGTTTYTDDSLYRLTAVTYPNTDSESFTYDQMGNRLTRVFNSTPTSYTYDNADQMTLAGGVTYTYDSNGNQTGAGTDTFGWDHENRLTSTSISSVSGSYAYNGTGLRTSRTIGATTVTYTWDVNGDLPLVLEDSDGNRYVYGLDLIARIDNAGTAEYHLYDGLGSTTGLSDSTGTVSGTYSYDAFGNVRTQTGATTEWSYTGEQNDSTGLEYLRARYYDSETGRFLAQDPLLGTAARPQTLNRYPYVTNNPANATDPSGLHCKLWRGGAHATSHCIPGPVEDFFTETIPDAAVAVGDWTYDHRYDIGQTITGAAITLSCTSGVMVVCIPALAAHAAITYLEVRNTEGKCQKIVAGVTGFLGGTPGPYPFGRFSGEVLAAMSGTISGVGCATTVYGNDTGGVTKE